MPCLLILWGFDNSGLPRREATRNDNKSYEIDKDAFIGGALMGIGFDGFGSAVSSAKTINYANSVYGSSQSSINSLIQNGLAMPEGSAAYSQAVKSQAKVDSGKKVSGTALYNLATAIQSEIETKSQARLNELGVDKKTVKELAPIVAKAVFGENLTLNEQSILKDSRYGIQVANELLADKSNTIWRDEKGVTSQGGVTSFVSKDGSIKTIPQITEKDGIRTIDATTIMDEDAFIEGLWEGSRKSKNDENAKNVEKSQLETFDNDNYDWYNKNNIIIDGSHLVDGKLKPNVKYKSGEFDYIYSTDDLGRICKVYVEELYYTERNKRLKHNSNTLGKVFGDHAGHLIADRFGGSKELDNLVSQSALVNLSEYKRIENQWARAIKKGQKVTTNIEVKYDGDSMRPSGFIIEYYIDGAYYSESFTN